MSVSVSTTAGNQVSVTIDGQTLLSFTTEESSVNVLNGGTTSISVSNQGPKGDTGADGADGQGLIVGGSENQFIQKNSATDYDTKWSAYTLPSADGDDGQVLTTDGAGAVSFAFPQTIAEAVKNVSGGTLVKGTPVHVAGSVGNLAEVIAADAATNYPAHFVLNQDLADDAEGLGIALGFINNVDVPDASIYTEGQTVYLGAAGGWTTTKPTGTNAIQNLGVLIKVNTSGNKVSGIIMGAGRSNDVPNIPDGQTWIGNASGVATPTTLAAVATSGAYSDLSGTPTIPSALSDLTGTSDDITEGTTNLFLTSAEETKLGFISVAQAVDLDTMESDIATNNAKVSNVTTDLSTTTAASTVTVNSSDGTDATISGATTSVAGVMTSSDKTKLDGIEASADVTDSTNVTSSLVGATAISAGDKTTIQTNLGVDPPGTDNSTDVTLAGTYDYITIVGQTITRNQVDYTTDISNTPTIPSALNDLTGTSDNITEGTTNKFLTTAEETKLGFVSVTQAVDLDTMESNIATNNAKVSNVTTDLTTTHAASTVTVNSSDGTDATINGATTSLAGVMTGTDKTKLDGIETSADVTDATNVTSSLVAATSISSGDKTTIQTNIGVDPAGTDNSTDATVGSTASDVLKVAAGQVLGGFDAGADKLVFWDDSEGKLTYATIGTNLTMTSTTLSASGGGGSANMVQDFSAPTSTGEFQDGARLVADAYGTAPSATAGTLVNFGNTAPSAVGAQSVSAAATGMLTVVTDAASGDELLVEGVIKMSSNTGWSTAKKGAPLYMSTTAGAVTTTAPSTAGEFVRVVGHVVDATNSTIYFKPDNTWLEL
jgi:hypothetical protein